MKELDEHIIRSAAHHKADAFRTLYSYYANFIWRVVFKMVNGDSDVATQVVQDVFVKAFISLKKYRFDAAFSTWLYRIVYTTTLNALRKRKIWVQKTIILDEQWMPSASSTAYEDRDLVNRILTQLNPQDRFLIVAREIDDIPFEDLESITGKSAGALRVQVSRIKERIREDFGDEIQREPVLQCAPADATAA